MATSIDLSKAVWDKPSLEGAVFDPPPAPRGTLGEVGTGLVRGALVGLPTLAGQAMQFASSPGNRVYEFGKGMVADAETRGQKPSLTLQPEQHGTVTNALASGAEMIAPGVAVPLALGAGAAAAGASPFLAGGAAIAGAGALFGAQAGQATLDKAEKAGVDPATAETAARLNAATTFATQTALGAVGGKLLGVFGQSMGKMFQAEAGPLAESTLKALTGTQGVLKPLAKALPTAAAEGVALNMGQAAASAGIENAYGVDSASPWEVAKEQIGPTLGMTALLTPLGLVARAAQVRSAQGRTASLAHPETAPEIRAQLAGEYAAQLEKVNPEAAGNFRLNANLAIQHKLAMDVDSQMLMPGAVQAPATTALLGRDPAAGNMVVFPDGTTGYRSDVDNYIAALPEDQQLAARARLAGLGEQPGAAPSAFAAPTPLSLGNAPTRPTLYTFPDGTTTRSLADVDKFVDSLPESQRTAARAKLLNLGPEDVKVAPIPQDALDLHTQVKQALADAGETPAALLTRKAFAESEQGRGLKGQELAKAYRAYVESPDTMRELMRQDADKFDAVQTRAAEQRAAEEPAAGQPRNPPPEDTGVPNDPGIGRVPLSEAMNAALKKRDEDAAFAQRDAVKMREQEAIANIARGEQLAAAAERGEVLPDANAPKRAEDLVADWTAAMAANEMDTKAQARVPFEKRLAALGVDKMATHQEQIDALKTIVDDKKATQAMRDRVSMLVNKLEAEQPAKPVDASTTEGAASKTGLEGAPPAALDILGQNILPSKPETAAQPPKAAAVTDTLAPNIPRVNVSALAETAADKVMALRVEFNNRLRAGEKLTPLEQERYEDLQAFAKTLDSYVEGKATPSDEGFVRSIAGFVQDASQPYKKSLRNVLMGPKMSDPGQADMGLLAPAALSHKATDVLQHLADNGSQPWVKALAAKLHPLVPNTSIWAGREVKVPEPDALGKRPQVTVGEYNTRENAIEIFRATEETILHETVHAATAVNIGTASQIKTPRNQREAQLKKAYEEIEAIRKTAKDSANAMTTRGNEQYGLSNAFEFVAELHANPEFQDFLRNTGGPQSLWGRTVDAVRRLLGMESRDARALDRAMTASEAFFTPERIADSFDASPEGAAVMVGETLKRVVAAADADRTPFTKMADAAFKAALPWKTVEFIAHQTRVTPEMVASGFSAGVDAHQRANVAHQVASEHLNSAGSKFIDRLDRTLRGIGDAVKAQVVQREMATIGGEASRIGFDYRKNFKDNLAIDSTLDPKDKPYIDEIHRRFTQLQRANPEAAKLLEDGERLNRAQLIDKVATLAANVMDARAGVARRLAADLERLPPGDAQRAVLENQIKAVTLESTLASQHSKGLDFLDPTLRTAKNADPERFLSGASSVLGQRLEAAFKAATALPAGSPLREHMAALQSIYSAQVKNPYFSLGRDGEFFVKVGFKGIDAAANDRIQAALQGTNKVVGDLTRGDDHAYFRVATADEAKALHDKLVQAGQGRVVETAWGRQIERVSEVSGVAPALRTLLGALEETVAGTPGLKPDQAALMKETITRQVLSMLPETAARSASMGRRGIPGYDANFLTSFARRAAAGVHDTAGLYTNRAYADAAKTRADAVMELNRTGSAEGRVRAQEVDNEINMRFANSMKPVGNNAVGMATSLSHSFYLGMSPAFFIRTMAQPWHRGLPIIGSKFGYAQGMGAIVQATPVAMKVIANTLRAATAKDGLRGIIGAPIELKGLDLTPGEQAFISELHTRGVLDLGESSQLQRAAKGGGQKMQDALRMAAVTAQMAEMSNRLVMGLAAFRLAEGRKGLIGKETSTEYAIRSINLAMDNFDPSNTARAIGRHGFAGPLTPLFTQFQNYALQTMQQISRTVHDGMFSQDKSVEGLQRSKEARREFAGLMATTGMLSGALGLPFANAFAGVYNNLMSDPDDPKDVRISIRNWAVSTFGKDAAGLLMHGPGHALGVDTASFGLAGLLPGSDFLASRMQWKDRAETQMRSMLGPAVSLGMDMGTAISKMAEGNWLKGIEAALPIGLRSYFKAAELARVGYTDSKGNPMPVNEAGPADIAWRVLGFQTADKAEQGDAARDFITNQRLLQHRRSTIADQYIKGLNDPSTLADAGQALQGFNSKNPSQAISSQEIAGAIRQHLTGRALGAASGTGVAVSKRQFPTLVENERFAAMPRP